MACAGNVQRLLARLRREGVRRPTAVSTRAMGRPRKFHAYDLGEDTFVFEKTTWRDLSAQASVLLAEKSALRPGGRGHVMTITTGNHSVAALPLLQGQFWDLAHIPAAKRGEAMLHDVLCANIVDGKLEISQRDMPGPVLTALDAWLTETLKFPLGDVVMVERIDATLEHYRRLGQEWRVKPLAWTEQEMSVALAANRKRISTALQYYHGSRGGHFLSYSGFHRLGELAAEDLLIVSDGGPDLGFIL